MSRNVQVQNTFSGPLDLLLYLVKRDEIDIHDIPISHLTQEYLTEIEKMGIDVEAGGEFVAMATVLTELKSRWLLPQSAQEEGADGEEEPMLDPREGLVKALLEYKQFKEVASELDAMAAAHAARYARRLPPPDFPRPPAAGEEYNSLHLFAAFQKIAARVMAEKRRREIVNEEVPTEIRIQQIETAVAARGQATFSSLLSDNPTRDELVGFFIAILELVRLKKIKARQSVDFSEIYLVPAGVDAGAGESDSSSVPAARDAAHPLRLAALFAPAGQAPRPRRAPAPANPFAMPPLCGRGAMAAAGAARAALAAWSAARGPIAFPPLPRLSAYGAHDARAAARPLAAATETTRQTTNGDGAALKAPERPSATPPSPAPGAAPETEETAGAASAASARPPALPPAGNSGLRAAMFAPAPRPAPQRAASAATANRFAFPGAGASALSLAGGRRAPAPAARPRPFPG